MSQSSIRRLIQLTDLHIGGDRNHRLAGICTYDSFRQVLAAVAARPSAPDMLMVTGDVAASGAAQAYRLFAEQIRFTDIPYAWLPGNHDDFSLMQSGIISAPYWPLLEFGEWRVISLNSAVMGQVGGALGSADLDFLATTLRRESAHPTVIFVHHPPVAVGCEWLDQQRISNAPDLENVVAQAGNVKAIFCGHVHQAFSVRWAGCQVFTTPSTCFQFAANSAKFAMSDDLPAYRWIDLHPDGHLETGVCHLKQADHVVDRGMSSY